MIPLRDSNPTRSIPWVNYSLIALNVLAFLWTRSAGAAGAVEIVHEYGVVPRELLAAPGRELTTVASGMFLHDPTTLAHLGGNMLFLWIFGDNVEEALGHLRYLVFYLVAGSAAAMAQVFIEPASAIPMIGASGAIGGVLGGYVVLHPRAPITVLNPTLPFGFFLGIFWVFPAWLVVAEWFVWNVIQGLGSLGLLYQGGVAFFAHIGGFVAGVLLVRPFMREPPRRIDPWAGWRPPRRSRAPRRAARDPWSPRGPFY